MSERTLVVDHLKLSYEGLFNASELYNIISSWFYEKGWDWYEKMNQELVTPSGKQIRWLFEPWKNISDYYKLVMAIKIHILDVKQVEVEHEGQKIKLDHGVIRITFDGYVVSDRKGKWTNKPFTWFLSIIFEKYFFREHYSKFELWIKSDVDDLHQKIKSYLNVFKYTYQH
ncbi:hypothetical protein HYX11_02355 [Candidatus Woesearchaeota archaeon]|nr:hypothetical protein [Candidatus Woesearchaeota archaeon]